jgi:hypothetical protein
MPLLSGESRFQEHITRRRQIRSMWMYEQTCLWCANCYDIWLSWWEKADARLTNNWSSSSTHWVNYVLNFSLACSVTEGRFPPILPVGVYQCLTPFISTTLLIIYVEAICSVFSSAYPLFRASTAGHPRTRIRVGSSVLRNECYNDCTGASRVNTHFQFVFILRIYRCSNMSIGWKCFL